MKNFWKMENRFSIEMNLASFYNRIYLCSTFDEYHRNIWLDFPQGRCLPTPPSSLLEGSYFNPIERLLNRCEIKYKSLDFSTDRNDIAFLAWLKTKKKRVERTNGWMEKFVIECLLLSLESALSACRAVSWLGNQRDRRREIPPGKSRDTIWHSWF